MTVRPRLTRPYRFEAWSPSRSATQHNRRPYRLRRNCIRDGSSRQRRVGALPDSERSARGQHLGLRLQIHFGIHVGRVDRDVTQPCADRVDIHARAQEVRGGRVPDHVRADRFFGERRTRDRCCCHVPCDGRVDDKPRDGRSPPVAEHGLVWRPSLTSAPAATSWSWARADSVASCLPCRRAASSRMPNVERRRCRRCARRDQHVRSLSRLDTSRQARVRTSASRTWPGTHTKPIHT